ncbi:hypothetical protein DSO57_1015774 [Entomophthora muscae]|uniref:Uncharacterized protein n=1 Tax=Entomophthora muscae TaxID=34485 RepID=A0ACC2T533_9FUNG|nr:hypothetical protein DSO57_1015774 [Entomophthora muscae]
MSNIGREFIGEEFARLLQGWYQPTEGLAPAKVQVYSEDAHLVIGKVLKEFALMQAKYKLLTNPSPLLENDDSSRPVPGYNPGNTMGTGDQEPHTPPGNNNNNSANHKHAGSNGHGNRNNGQLNCTHFCITATKDTQDKGKAQGEH